MQILRLPASIRGNAQMTGCHSEEETCVICYPWAGPVLCTLWEQLSGGNSCENTPLFLPSLFFPRESQKRWLFLPQQVGAWRPAGWNKPHQRSSLKPKHKHKPTFVTLDKTQFKIICTSLTGTTGGQAPFVCNYFPFLLKLLHKAIYRQPLNTDRKRSASLIENRYISQSSNCSR